MVKDSFFGLSILFRKRCIIGENILIPNKSYYFIIFLIPDRFRAMSGHSGCSLTKHPFLKKSLRKAHPITHPTPPLELFVDWTKELSRNCTESRNPLNVGPTFKCLVVNKLNIPIGCQLLLGCPQKVKCRVKREYPLKTLCALVAL